MKDKDYIKELFSEKLSGHEVPVRGDLWSGIQSQMANTATTAATKGISIATKWAIGIASSVLVAGSVVWLASSDGETSQNNTPQISQVETNVSPVAEEKESANTSVTAPVNASNQNTANVAQNRQQSARDNNNNGVISVGIQQTEPGKEPLILKERSVVSTENQQERREDVSKETAEKEVARETTPVSNNSNVIGKVEEWAKTNTFSPNNDGINDFFYLKTNNLKEFNISIINDRGQVVFTSPEPDFKWDGTDRKTGEIVPAGNYVYMIIATDKNDNPIKLYNSLTVSK